jgi:hypothetical protein
MASRTLLQLARHIVIRHKPVRGPFDKADFWLDYVPRE